MDLRRGVVRHEIGIPVDFGNNFQDLRFGPMLKEDVEASRQFLRKYKFDGKRNLNPECPHTLVSEYTNTELQTFEPHPPKLRNLIHSKILIRCERSENCCCSPEVRKTPSRNAENQTRRFHQISMNVEGSCLEPLG